MAWHPLRACVLISLAVFCDTFTLTPLAMPKLAAGAPWAQGRAATSSLTKRSAGARGVHMTAEGKTLVAGSTGKVGGMIVRRLAEAGTPVVALARNPDSAEAKALKELPNVEVIKGDCRDRASLDAAVAGCERVVATVANRPLRFGKISDLWTDPFDDPTHPANLNYKGIENLLEASKAAGVKKFVRLSGLSVGLSPWSPVSIIFALVLAFSNKWNRRGEMAIRASGLDYTVVRPSGLKDCPKGSETGDKLILASESWGKEGPPATTGISREDVCDLILLSLTDPRCKNATLRVSRWKRPTANTFYQSEERADYTWETQLDTIEPDTTPLKDANYGLPVAVALTAISWVLGALFSIAMNLLRMLFARFIPA